MRNDYGFDNKHERKRDNELEAMSAENPFRQEYTEETEHDYFDCFINENIKEFLSKKDSSDYIIDDSQEANELRNMGINFVDIKEVDVNNKKEIVSAVDDMFRAHPELRGQLTAIICQDMGRATYAGYGPLKPDERFGGVLVLNSKKFSDPKLRDELMKAGANGWWMPDASPASIISHELGHGMHLELCALDCGVKNGIQAERNDYKKVLRQYKRDLHASEIVEQACADCGIKFDSWDCARALSSYGTSSYGEALAEAVAEVRNSEEPRPLATAIYSRLEQYKEKMKGGKQNDDSYS